MALSGLHVACCFAGVPGGRDSEMPIISTPVWSESPASETATSNAAPNYGDVSIGGRAGQPIFRVISSAEAYVSIGDSPNASSSPRHIVQAFIEYDFAVQPGDKLAWVAT